MPPPGELGLLGRRQENVDVALVTLPGARYDVHGIKSYPAPLLLEVDAEAAALALGATAERHAAELGGFVSLAYDTPGFGYGTRFADGTAVLHRRIGVLPDLSDDANILITPGAGTLDEEGRLIKDRMRPARTGVTGLRGRSATR